MKKIILIFIFLFYILSVKSQITEELLIKVHPATTTEMNALIPNEGALIYNTTDKSLYVYNGTVWEKHKNLTTTHETISISGGNQTINVRDASKIIGFTLISSSNNLSSGKMSDTWIINTERNIIRCSMQSLDYPDIKYLFVSVRINNATNTISINNYTSRFWKITNTTPQSSLSNNGTDFSLSEIVVLRRE